MISAKIIADSQNLYGNRITTFVLTFPRIVLAEFNTHRMISKNSASSRAIPFKKMLKMVQENPFVPIKWMEEHSGMQGTKYITNPEDIQELEYYWRESAKEAANNAAGLSEKGITKQLCNRMLEPFMYHTVIATGTEWENFFALRANDQAEIHIQDLAYKMLEAYNTSKPKLLKAGEWHIPFGDQIKADKIALLATSKGIEVPISNVWINEVLVKIATSRCARVSYLNFEGKDDYQADIELYNRLATSGHYSPFEHCAKAMSIKEFEEHSVSSIPPKKGVLGRTDYGWCGNFRGFIQLRKTMQGENKQDARVVKN